MKFSCYKNDLTEALQFVIRAVAVKPMTPILAGIYLKAEGSMLELQANNFSPSSRFSRLPFKIFDSIFSSSPLTNKISPSVQLIGNILAQRGNFL